MSTTEIPRDKFFRDVTSNIKQQVEATSGLKGFSTKDRGNVMEIPIAGVKGCHYEIGFHRDGHEIALHFQGTAENNRSRSEGFRPHLPKLEKDLGRTLILGPHEGGNRKRLWIKLPLNPLTQDLLEQYSDLTARLIVQTYPILKSILDQEYQNSPN